MESGEPDIAEVKNHSEVAGHIARVAAGLFASRGYDATSVRAIVEAAGVTKPTLYYHFGSKEGLAKALVKDPLAGFVAGLRRCLDADADPVAIMAGQVQVSFDFMLEDPDRGRLFYAMFFGPHESSLSAELGGFGLQIDQAFAEGVDRLVRAGLVDRERAGRFMLACRGAIVVHTMDFLYDKPHCGHETPVEYGPGLARAIVIDLLRGFGPPAA